MAIGRHAVTLSGERLTLEITTDGWVSNGEFGIDKGGYATGGVESPPPHSIGFIFWRDRAPDNVNADPCTNTRLNPPAGASASELASAVSTIPGTTLVSAPAEVRIGGFPAQHVAISVPDGVGCIPSEFRTWGFGTTYRYPTEFDSIIRAWIIDVDGTLVWIDGETYIYSGPDAERELQQIVDSILFE